MPEAGGGRHGKVARVALSSISAGGAEPLPWPTYKLAVAVNRDLGI